MLTNFIYGPIKVHSQRVEDRIVYMFKTSSLDHVKNERSNSLFSQLRNKASKVGFVIRNISLRWSA